MHTLKVICLVCWSVLVAFQATLPWLAGDSPNYWLALLALPLLIPLAGLLRDKRYTYKWVGFLMLLYFCIGISELFSNPELRIYGLATTVASTLLFLSSIYYARYLGMKHSD